MPIIKQECRNRIKKWKLHIAIAYLNATQQEFQGLPTPAEVRIRWLARLCSLGKTCQYFPASSSFSIILPAYNLAVQLSELTVVD